MARKSRPERTGGEAERPQNRAAVNDRQGNIFILSTDVERLWRDIPAAERFELLATIAEMREWRGKPSDRPIQPAALALHQWLTETCHKGARRTPDGGPAA